MRLAERLIALRRYMLHRSVTATAILIAAKRRFAPRPNVQREHFRACSSVAILAIQIAIMALTGRLAVRITPDWRHARCNLFTYSELIRPQ